MDCFIYPVHSPCFDIRELLSIYLVNNRSCRLFTVEDEDLSLQSTFLIEKRSGMKLALYLGSTFGAH